MCRIRMSSLRKDCLISGFLIFSLCCVLLLGCDLDPFGLADRHIAGAYSLSRFETSWFAIEGPLKSPLEHLLVYEIGWNEEWIFARVPGEGWFVIDVVSQTDTGPISEEEARKRLDGLQIKTCSTHEAWRLLGSRRRPRRMKDNP